MTRTDPRRRSALGPFATDARFAAKQENFAPTYYKLAIIGCLLQSAREYPESNQSIEQLLAYPNASIDIDELCRKIDAVDPQVVKTAVRLFAKSYRIRRNRKVRAGSAPFSEDCRDRLAIEDPASVGESSDVLSSELSAVIARLPTDEQALIVDRFFRGKTLDQLSEKYRLPVTTLHRQLNNTLQRLKNAFSPAD